MLKVGDKAPDFKLKDETGREISLSSFRDKKVVIYFYPKMIPQDAQRKPAALETYTTIYLEAGAVVIGISKDDARSHERFKNKYNLPFYLLSDPENEVIEQYGAWQEKKMYGKTYMGIARITYIVDGEGIVKKVYSKSKARNTRGGIIDRPQDYIKSPKARQYRAFCML